VSGATRRCDGWSTGATWRGLATLLVALVLAGVAAAHDEETPTDAPTVIRDTEIERDIRTLASPVWRAAGLEPSDVGVYLIKDSQINSFVAGGQAVFINTGLIERAENPDELIGVIAHETGHIAGGHILRSKQAMHNASIESIIAIVFGAAASVLGHSSGPLIAAEGVGIQSYLHFSIGQEATADHAALNFLDRACVSARGLLQFFEILQSSEPLTSTTSSADNWARTHPLTTERIDYVRHHVETARCSNAPDPPGDAGLLRVIHAKLHAFLDAPSTTFASYPASDTSPVARYARAIAYYRIPDLTKAIPEIDGLIRDFPSNPYYRELKGQMLFENGRVRDAVQPYQDAVRLLPDAPLLRIELSQVYEETGDPALNKRAIAYLEDASREEAHDGDIWHFLAVAYGRDNQIGMAALSLAEGALADGKKRDALQQANRAKQLLARNSPAYARALEIHREAEELDD
jgi:predicted Zn-dependent protease